MGYFFLQKKKSDIAPLTLTTLYGDFTIAEPVLIELLQDPYMQRLKHIRQYGTNYYTIKKQDFNRFDHSVGVFVLLRKYGASLNEQIAGLLHDVSHTVFSHCGDYLFKVSQLDGSSYQDTIHEKFINKTSIPKILEKYGISVRDILHKNSEFILLEQKLPEICADRLEYNLQGGIVDGLLDKKDIQTILNSLTVQDGKWIFTDLESAKKIAQVPFFFMQNENGWNNYKSFMANEIMAEVLKRALDVGLLTENDIHYSTDEIVWEKLVHSDDELLCKNLQKALHIEKHIQKVEHDEYDFFAKNKFRGIDPFVKTERGILRLTELDSEFNNKFNEVKQYIEAGWRIKFIS